MSDSHAAVASYEQPVNWEAKKISIFKGLFFCAFMALCSRGVLEVTVGKVLAYGVQVGLWSLVLLASVTAFRYRITNLLGAGIVLTLLFGLSASVSSFLTMDAHGFYQGIISALVNVYLLFLFVFCYGFQSDAFSPKPILISMAVAGTLLPIAGFLQLFHLPFMELPGRSIIRPPSLTGSFLHFPLICGVLVICLLEGARALRWRYLYFASFLSFIGVLISGGRSGAVVIVGAVGLFFLFEFFKRPAATKLKFGGMALAAASLIGALFAAGYQYIPLFQRISKVWDLQDGGNVVRIGIWKQLFAYWLNTNLWFGEYTGMVGNATNNVNGTGIDYSGSSLVAESGTLQQLINFGVFGLLFFYAVMLLAYPAIDKKCSFLRALFIAAMIQTLFYQSTEVLPYMAMLAFLPLFSRSLVNAAGSNYSNHGR